ncbi:hypothetical protein, partial [uncultured Fusobacterium sp.]|uniref:hypothetical protein n=1 Tax=uncultured Fusobacterium sp. TaxID=159267 RepID=UPI0025D18B62
GKADLKELFFIKDESVDSSELKWNNYSEFLKYEDNLVEFLKTFSKEDLKNIYFQGVKRGIIKKSQEKYFSNIFTRINLKFLFTNSNFENIIPFYKEIIEQMKEEKAFEPVTDMVYGEERETVSSINDTSEETLKLTESEPVPVTTDALFVKEEPIITEAELISTIEDRFVEEEIIEPIITKVEPMPVTDVPYGDESVTEEVYTFDKILSEGLKSGEVSTEELQKIDYEAEEEVSDIYEAIEILEERGIIVNY